MAPFDPSPRSPVPPRFPWSNLVAMFFDQAGRLGDRPLLWAKRDGRYTPWSWSECASRVRALAARLRSLGVAPGDRVVIVSENRPEWCVADLAIMAAGGVTVPAYTTNTEDDHLYILEHSEAKAVIISTAKLAPRVLAAAARAANVEVAIVIDAPPPRTDGRIVVTSWDDDRGAGDRAPDPTDESIRVLSRDDVACIIYTSGTGGSPKGVMLHHGALLHNCEGAARVLDELGGGDQVFLSFLPLSHAYEHTVGQFLPLAIGAQIYYAESIEKVLANFEEARPTIATAVPRFYELVHQRIVHGVRKSGGWKARLFDAAETLGTARYRHPEQMSALDRLKDAVLDRLVRAKIRERFGGRLVALVSGGAPLNLEVGVFLRAIGLPVFQGYGQTEAAPLISVNSPKRANKLHTVGAPLEGVEVMIAPDGEILVRGGMVMKGYWRNPEATAEVLRDGWLCTGDVGEIDADGDIRITDRKKDIIVNSGGDNISPSRIEGLLTLRPEIGQAMVYGDKRPHLVALLSPDKDWLASWAKAVGKPVDPAALADDPELQRALLAVVEEVNKTMSIIDRVRRVAIASEPFSVENGQLTPTLKIRRHVIRARYGATLDRLYQ